MNNRKAGAGLLAGSLLVFVMLCTGWAEDVVSNPVDSQPIFFEMETGFVSGQGTSSSTITENTLYEEDTKGVSSIVGSVNGNQGIVSVNQSSGSINNQSNVRAFSTTADPFAITKVLTGISPRFDDNKIRSAAGIRQDLIDKSFRDNLGIMGLNQAAGSLNYQGNTAVVVIGGPVSLTEAQLDNVRASNNDTVEENIELLEDIIRDSLSNSQGVFQVTQSAGNLNMQENNLGLSMREIYVR